MSKEFNEMYAYYKKCKEEQQKELEKENKRLSEEIAKNNIKFYFKNGRKKS